MLTQNDKNDRSADYEELVKSKGT